MIPTKILTKFRIGRGEFYIIIAGMVVLLWLHGNLLFFWDVILPFHPTSDIYFYSFTWNQAIFNGLPNTPNEWLSYFAVIYILHDAIGFPLQLSQFALFYSLFTLSGITMYRLIKFLTNEIHDSTFSLHALAGALVYMFNFYADAFLLSGFFESWFIYSLLPLIILIFLGGIGKSTKKEIYWKEIICLIVLFEVTSVSFWEEPYLIWTIFIIFVFILSYVLQNRNRNNESNYVYIAKFLIISVSAIIITGLWYIYTYIHVLFGSLKSVSQSGTGGSLTSYYLLINSLTSVGSDPLMRLLYLVAVYPVHSPTPGPFFAWQNVYMLMPAPLNIILIGSGIIFLFTVFFPMTRRGNSKNKIINNKLLYGSIFILIFFGLQGINPVLRWIIDFLLNLNFPFISILYGTNMQFLGFPLIFLYAIAVSKTFFMLNSFSKQGINSKRLQKNNKIKSSKIYKNIFAKKHIKLITVVLLITVVSVYPWYMWTPYATPVYDTGYGNQQVPSSVNIPNYVFEMTDYIHANANDSTTLILPTSSNFLTMSFNGSSFADDQYPALMMGAPVLFQTQIANNNVTTDIENLVYNPLMLGNNLSNYLSELNIKFIILNKDFIVGAGNYFYENVTYLQTMLQHQPYIQLVKVFGPLQVYENMANAGIITMGTATHFNPTLSQPYGEKSIIRNLEAKGFTHYQLPPVAYNITDNGSIILENNRLISTENPVYFVNNNPLGINESVYHYLSITFKTSSSNVSLYVNTATGFSNDSFGNSILQPLNLSSYTLSPLLSVNSTHYKTFIYPLYGQPPMWYSAYNKIHNYTLNSIYLSLSFNHLIANESGYIEITNVSVSKYINSNENFYYLASGVNNTNQVLVSNNIYTNNTSPSKATVSSKEVNPTKYVVDVRDANVSFVLDFKQNFNSGWKIYINGKESNDSHFAADIYNNGWLITQKGNYTIEIIYGSQHEYNIVTGISLYSFIIIAALVVSFQLYMIYFPQNRKWNW